MSYQGLIHRYSSTLPVAPGSIVSLLEGNTPLLKTTRLQEHLGLPCEIYLKFEGLNPTGSFKDRGMTYAVSKAVEAGSKAIICASTGNTSASAAAYAAKGNLKCIILIPQGKIAFGKLAQAMMHGAQIIQVKGNFDEALEVVKQIAQKMPVQIVNSINPYRLEGQKTAAFEVCDVLGGAPDYHFLPVGNAGNITAYWMGYKQYRIEGKTVSLPKMMGFQAAGAAPIVLGKKVNKPKTVATAIQIGNPASWQGALKARDESGGLIDKVTDTEILKAYRLIAQLEGYFCEPASAASVAGVIKMASKKIFKEGERVVCTLTGHGLKDPNTGVKLGAKPKVSAPKFENIIKLLRI